MPNRGGSEGSSPLSFTRRTLQSSSRSLVTEYEGVNPHKFYRGLRAKLTELRGHRDPPYEVVAQRARDLSFDPEAAGEGTGAFTGRLQARSKTPSLGPARLDHRPWAPQAAGVVALGLVLTSLGLVWNLFAFLGLAVTGAGAALFTRTREGTVPLQRRDVISVLVEGEARESVREGPTGRSCELSAEMGVHYAGDVFLTIPPHEIPELDWGLRAELGNRAARWEALLDDGPAPSEDGVATRFLDACRAWALLDDEWTRRRVERLQREVRASLAVRQAHTELLADLRAADARDRELDRIGRELETLANEMDAYVERERRPPVGLHALSRQNGHEPQPAKSDEHRAERARPDHLPRAVPLRPRDRRLEPPARVIRPPEPA